MRVSNTKQGQVLATDCVEAKGFWQRGRGLLFRPPLKPGEGLLLTPCQSVHTFLMGFAIDVVFLDARGKVVHLIEAMVPQRISPIVWRARSTLELPPGTIGNTKTKVGDELAFE
ncbi:MAG: DUF192 domain-containing protein [Chloroflexota bacterium]